MNLAERLDQARHPLSAQAAADQEPGSHRAARRPADPFDELKASVHQSLLETLGPKLYDPRIEAGELEQRVRQTLQTVLETEQTPLSSSDRTRIAQEIADDILGHGPLEP
jgi:pilus assembly protein CpaF